MRNNKKYVLNKRHPVLNSPEKIWKSSPVSKTLCKYRGVHILFIILLPNGILTVNICNYNIHSLEFPKLKFIKKLVYAFMISPQKTQNMNKINFSHTKKNLSS